MQCNVMYFKVMYCNACMYICMYVCMVWMICMYVCMDVCKYVYMFVCLVCDECNVGGVCMYVMFCYVKLRLFFESCNVMLFNVT